MKTLKRIYLDYASTTPVDPKVLNAMLPYLKEKYGNRLKFKKKNSKM